MFTTGAQDREPLYGVGRRTAYACGATAYISCLAALIWRDRTGESQVVEAVTAEATAAMAQNLVTQYSYSRTYASRRQYPGMLAQLMCRDGWLVLFALRGWPAICRIFGSPELAEDPRFAGVAALRRNWSDAVALLREKARGSRRGGTDRAAAARQGQLGAHPRPCRSCSRRRSMSGRGMFRAGRRGQAGQPGPGLPHPLAAPRAGPAPEAGRARPVRERRAWRAAAPFRRRPLPTACRCRDCACSTSPRPGPDR